MDPSPYYSSPPAKSKTLGVVAFIVGLVVIVFSVIASVIVGNLLGSILKPGSTFSQGFQAGATSTDPRVAFGGLLVVVQLLLGTGLGVWAFVQGIVAVRSDRGRGWGIAAIVIAAIAPVLSLIVYIAVGAVVQAATH
ncbi:MAG TPA: hypothetical protein VHX87_04090 [Galbitalea sp.]|jgi:uncharacterized membrane protein HdeD (DUF308 family)|nr:hypothetical protein [Galbitalea sp.]